MSYCEFWYRPMVIDDSIYDAIERDVNQLQPVWKENQINVEHLTALTSKTGENHHQTKGIVVTGAYGTFIFPQSLPEDFKNIYVTLIDGRMFQFVKTNQNRYGLAVQAILIIAKHYLNEQIIVTSNGDEHDWQEAREIVINNLGYGLNFELDESPPDELFGMKLTWNLV